MGGDASKELTSEELLELERRTHFTKKEIRLWHKYFLKDCPSGNLGKEDFQLIYKQIFPNGNPAKFSKFIFSVFDADSSGSITFDEFIKALSVTTRGTLKQKLTWAFSLYDIDKDGKITRDEMINIVTAIFEMVGDKMEEKQETPASRVNVVFTVMDTNQDGYVTMDEFINGAMKDQWIVTALSLDLTGLPASVEP
ncbi:ncs1 [Bugula neritina]|uniref:Ncs1 n=1 Tax=Bugula neritina TaxID=10212 RepID=A0A7J7J816_BUGNE|nr:ncs1 [Bugula neritina]